MARESYLDELDWQLRAVVAQVAQTAREAAAEQDIERCLECWESARAPAVARWRLLLKQIRDARTQDYAMYAVAVRALLALAQPQPLAP
jgi:glutamate dehydrogenase